MYWERQTNALASLSIYIKDILLKYKTLMHKLVPNKQNIGDADLHFQKDSITR